MALIINTEKYRNKYSDKDNYEIIYKCYFDQIFKKYEE